MGWWSEETDGKELLIGDEPLDEVGIMLSNVMEAYQKDAGRKPTPNELARTLESVLAAQFDVVFDGVENRDFVSIIIKTKKRSTTKYTPQVGDYFAVPLPKGGYGYGRIDDAIKKSLLLVQLLDIYSRELLNLESVRDVPVLFDCACGVLGLAKNDWPLLGNDTTHSKQHEESENTRMMAFLGRLGVTYRYSRVAEILEERLKHKGRI